MFSKDPLDGEDLLKAARSLYWREEEKEEEQGEEVVPRNVFNWKAGHVLWRRPHAMYRSASKKVFLLDGWMLLTQYFPLLDQSTNKDIVYSSSADQVQRLQNFSLGQKPFEILCIPKTGEKHQIDATKKVKYTSVSVHQPPGYDKRKERIKAFYSLDSGV